MGDVKIPESAEAQAQGGGEEWDEAHDLLLRAIASQLRQNGNAVQARVIEAAASALAARTAPPSAPVGVEDFDEWYASYDGVGGPKNPEQLARDAWERAAALARHPAPSVPVGIPPSGVAWRPIETAPKDNKHPLYLAQFDPDTGELIELDWDASWESESESWEIPQVYYIWRSANGRVEEPTHWAYQNTPEPKPAAVDGAINGKVKLWFFRDLTDAQRLALFRLFGLPTEELLTHMDQKRALAHVLAAQPGGSDNE